MGDWNAKKWKPRDTWNNRQVWPGLQNEPVIIVVQSLTHVWLIATQWTAAGQASLSFTISQFPQTHVCWVGEAIQSSCPLSCLLFFPAIMSFPMSQLFISTGQSIGASASASVFKEYSGLISFSIDWFDLLAIHGTLKSLLQHHTLKASVLWHSDFFMVQLTSFHDYFHDFQNDSFDYTDLCWQSDVSAF